ncbi:uracil-DNA glycosylase [Curtobacterium luteum]|uniref:uracil-DNA glycosylase n=1 Tax=Curtobacterium luteum TaxID=33881 RepID=UPI003828C333
MNTLYDGVLNLRGSSTACNFYLDGADSHSAFATTAAQRRAALLTHLEDADGGDLVLVGEAAGWRGARQSGVAFTAAPTVGLPGTAEASATVVRAALRDLQLLDGTLLWNAFPLHPHHANDVRSNRAPTRAELRSAEHLVAAATAHRYVVCVGQTAARTLSSLSVEVESADTATATDRVVAVRHPSFGGASLFTQQITAATRRWGIAGHPTSR